MNERAKKPEQLTGLVDFVFANIAAIYQSVCMTKHGIIVTEAVVSVPMDPMCTCRSDKRYCAS